MEIIVLSRRPLPLSLSVSILSPDMGKNASFVLFRLRRLFSFCCHCWPEFITSFVSQACFSSSSSHWPASSHLLLSCESDVFSFAPLKSHLTIPRPVKPNPVSVHTFTVYRVELVGRTSLSRGAAQGGACGKEEMLCRIHISRKEQVRAPTWNHENAEKSASWNGKWGVEGSDILVTQGICNHEYKFKVQLV